MDDPTTLTWQGPLMLGNLPDTRDGVDRLKVRAVYFFVRSYNKRQIVYVGRSNDFSRRLAEHYGDFLSSKYGTLYNDDGCVFRPGGRAAFFKSPQEDLDQTIKHAIADARRVKFLYAQVENALEELEATLISRIKRKFPTYNFPTYKVCI